MSTEKTELTSWVPSFAIFIAVTVLLVWWAINSLGSDSKEGSDSATSTSSVASWVRLNVTEEWSEKIYLPPGHRIRLIRGDQVIARSQIRDEILKGQPLGDSLWFQFRAKEGSDAVVYCLYPEGKEPRKVCR